MNKMIILQGCPCSGKSTWTKNFLETCENKDNWMVINRDSIRYRLGNGKYTMDHEKEVNEIESSQLEFAVNQNMNLIIDATNLNPKTIARWNKFAEDFAYEIEFKEFYIPFAEAMKRSEQRKKEGGLYINKKVMLDFYNRYYKERLDEEFRDKRIIKPVNEELPNAIICDLDATFALHQGRQPFDWSRIPEDKADPRLKLILDFYAQNGVEILFVTGRNEIARKDTEIWLNENLSPTAKWKLFTRQNNDFSSGDYYKRKVYKEHIEDKYNVLCVFEDSNKCVAMWRSEGLLTCQVENSDY